MITTIKAFRENLLQPRNLDSRLQKEMQNNLKFLQQETIDGDFNMRGPGWDVEPTSVMVKQINGNVKLRNMPIIPRWLSNVKINGNIDTGLEVAIHDGQLRKLDWNYDTHFARNAEFNFKIDPRIATYEAYWNEIDESLEATFCMLEDNDSVYSISISTPFDDMYVRNFNTVEEGLTELENIIGIKPEFKVP